MPTRHRRPRIIPLVLIALAALSAELGSARQSRRQSLAAAQPSVAHVDFLLTRASIQFDELRAAINSARPEVARKALTAYSRSLSRTHLEFGRLPASQKGFAYIARRLWKTLREQRRTLDAESTAAKERLNPEYRDAYGHLESMLTLVERKVGKRRAIEWKITTDDNPPVLPWRENR